MALTKITSRILDSSGVTILGTIATGVWQGTPINQTYLVGQSGTNTGDETLARINALDITELGTISSGVWNGTAINQTYLVGQSGTNTGDETLARINALDITELGTVSSGVWNGTVIASDYLDADTAHLSTTQTFTGAKTFSSNVGIGTTPSNWKSTWKALNIGQSVGLFSQDNNTTGLSSNVIFDGSNWTNKNIGATAFYQQSEGAHYFYGNGSSTDAAGTTFSPTTRLTISSGGEAFLSSTLGLTIGQSSASGTRTRLIYDGVYSYSTALYLNAVSSQPIYFKTSNTTRLTISSGGDLLTSDGTFTMHDGGGSPLAFKGKSSNGGSEIDWYANNGTTRIGYLEIAQTAASKLNIETANDLEIYTNSTKRLTISSGGVVNINTTGSGTQKLQVIGGIQNWYDTNFNRSTKVGYDGIYISGSQNGYLESPQDWVFYAGGSEKMRLASGGQVAIGTGINTTKFRVLQSANGEWTAQFINTGTQPYGISIDTSANSSNAYSLAVYTNSNTGLFVKNNARVGIGTTNPSSTLHVSGTIRADASAIANNPLIVVSDTGGGLVTFQRSSAYTQMYMASTTSGNQFYVRSQGSGGVVLATGGTSWGNGSDARLKKNFETTQGLSEVLQIEPIKYHLKTQDNSETKKLGFKAQNLQTVIPEMILDMDEEDPEDGSKYLGIIPDYLFPVLVKAIQEQQTIIEDLKSRIETLEG